MTRVIRFDTDRYWWLARIDNQGRYMTATVKVHEHAVAQLGRLPIEPRQLPQVSPVTDTERDRLIARIREQIEQLDGHIREVDAEDK